LLCGGRGAFVDRHDVDPPSRLADNGDGLRRGPSHRLATAESDQRGEADPNSRRGGRNPDPVKPYMSRFPFIALACDRRGERLPIGWNAPGARLKS
jgi:hypothetical protein